MAKAITSKKSDAVSTGKGATDKKEAKSAFMKTLKPSEALAKVTGATPLPRTEVVKKLWDYIKANNLQDQANKRNINADAILKPIFGKQQVSMFEMAGLIGSHLS